MKNPFDVTLDDSEDDNQEALFSVIRVMAAFGLHAARDPLSWSGAKGHAKSIAESVGMGITEEQKVQLCTIYAVPNGVHLAKGGFSGAVAIARGLTPGIPDVCCPVSKQGFNALYVELKTPRGKPTDSQKKMIPLLLRNNNRVEYAVGWKQAIRIITTYLEIET